MRHIALLVQYDGTDYSGFQIQPEAPTIQGELEGALARLLQNPVRVIGASRTDAGVHALGQVVAFDTESPIPLAHFPGALNAILPTAIGVVAADEMPEGFHPRYSAQGKLYSYRLLNRGLRSPFLERYAWRVAGDLSIEPMRDAASQLVGKHDFAAFCASGGSATTTVRSLSRLDIEQDGDLVEFLVSGDGFLYKMVRIIVGTLVEAGMGRRTPEDVGRVLKSRDRNLAGKTAAPQGLCLVKVDY